MIKANSNLNLYHEILPNFLAEISIITVLCVIILCSSIAFPYLDPDTSSSSKTY